MKSLSKARVFVVGGGLDYIRLFLELGYTGAKGVGDADIVLFTGGEDVSPELYGEKPCQGTNFNRYRDDREKIIYEEALKLGLPMVGICRGGQFLNVMNGGKMWQHVNNHCRTHFAETVKLKGSKEARRTFQVTSTHHQMMRPSDKGVVLLVADETSSKSAYGEERIGRDPKNPDVEVVWYPDTNCLCFQPHPEFPHCPRSCVDYFEELLDNYVLPMAYSQEAKLILGQVSNKKEK